MSAEKQPARIKGLKDLQKIKQQVLAANALREGGWKSCVTVHMGTCGEAAGAGPVLEALRDELAASQRTDVRLTTSGCIGVCSQEPVMTVETLGEPPVIYARLDADAARLVFREHALQKRIVPQLAIAMGKE